MGDLDGRDASLLGDLHDAGRGPLVPVSAEGPLAHHLVDVLDGLAQLGGGVQFRRQGETGRDDLVGDLLGVAGYLMVGQFRDGELPVLAQFPVVLGDTGDDALRQDVAHFLDLVVEHTGVEAFALRLHPCQVYPVAVVQHGALGVPFHGLSKPLRLVVQPLGSVLVHPSGVGVLDGDALLRG